MGIIVRELQWTAKANKNWITVSPSAGIGNMNVTITASPSTVVGETDVVGIVTFTCTSCGNTIKHNYTVKRCGQSGECDCNSLILVDKNCDCNGLTLGSENCDCNGLTLGSENCDCNGLTL